MTLLLGKIVVVVVILAVTVLRLVTPNGRGEQEDISGMPAREMSVRARVLTVVALVIVGVALSALR